MKKVLFLLLSLVIFGTASVSAQVRIGGDEAPNDAAVLDLNVDDDTNNGTKGLALPRVSLDNITATLDGTTANIDGMLVYNTGGTLTAGIYYWNSSRWVALQTYGLWTGTATCTECETLGATGSFAMPWSRFDPPSWAATNNCWVIGTTHAQMYKWAASANVFVLGPGTAGGPPSFRMFCWGPLG